MYRHTVTRGSRGFSDKIPSSFPYWGSLLLELDDFNVNSNCFTIYKLEIKFTGGKTTWNSTKWSVTLTKAVTVSCSSENSWLLFQITRTVTRLTSDVSSEVQSFSVWSRSESRWVRWHPGDNWFRSDPWSCLLSRGSVEDEVEGVRRGWTRTNYRMVPDE